MGLYSHNSNDFLISMKASCHSLLKFYNQESMKCVLFYSHTAFVLFASNSPHLFQTAQCHMPLHMHTLKFIMSQPSGYLKHWPWVAVQVLI